MKFMQFSMALGLIAAPLQAQDEVEAFVEANLLGIFYHELGHAIIDLEGVPIFGQEEDAADVFSIFLIDALYDEESAQSLAYDASFGFAGEALLRDEQGGDVAWWDVHGPDEQRFYNTVCLFYGANPDARDDFAADMDLPEDRADYCPDEFAQANDAWGAVLDQMADQDGQDVLFDPEGDSLTADIIGAEVDALNTEIRFSAPLTVRVDYCDEANAFYDPQDQTITMCLEFEDHLREIYARL